MTNRRIFLFNNGKVPFNFGLLSGNVGRISFNFGELSGNAGQTPFNNGEIPVQYRGKVVEWRGMKVHRNLSKVERFFLLRLNFDVKLCFVKLFAYYIRSDHKFLSLPQIFAVLNPIEV